MNHPSNVVELFPQEPSPDPQLVARWELFIRIAISTAVAQLGPAYISRLCTVCLMEVDHHDLDPQPPGAA